MGRDALHVAGPVVEQASSTVLFVQHQTPAAAGRRRRTRFSAKPPMRRSLMTCARGSRAAWPSGPSKSGDAPRAMARSRRLASNRGPRPPETRSALPLRPRRSCPLADPAQNHRAAKRRASETLTRRQGSGAGAWAATGPCRPSCRRGSPRGARCCAGWSATRAGITHWPALPTHRYRTHGHSRGAAKLMLPPCRPDGRRAGSLSAEHAPSAPRAQSGFASTSSEGSDPCSRDGKPRSN